MPQGKKYEKVMLAAIEQMNKATDPLSELEIASSFEEIALNVPKESEVQVLKAAEKFKSYHNEDPLWPTWGEDLNQAELDKLK